MERLVMFQNDITQWIIFCHTVPESSSLILNAWYSTEVVNLQNGNPPLTFIL